MNVVGGFLAVTAIASGVSVPVPANAPAGGRRLGSVAGSVVDLDSHGHVAKIALADGRTILQEYSPSGRITSQRAADGTDIKISYDARGRIENVKERGITRTWVYDDENNVAGTVVAATPAALVATMRSVGLSSGNGDQQHPANASDHAGRLVSAQNALGRVRFAYVDSRTLRQTLDRSAWTFSVERKENGGTITLSDSAGGRFSYTLEGQFVTSVRDADGRVISTRTYDSMGRVLRMSVMGIVNIDYAYDAGFDWNEKTISLNTGEIIKRFARRDYADPDLDGRVHAEFRGPTGEVIAAVDGEQLSYRAGVLTPFVSLSADGQVLARSFAFGSSVAYSDDEIRITADGTVHVLAALPHAEFTVASRTVRPFDVSIPPRASKVATAAATNNSRFKTAPNLYSLVQSCEYVPGGCVDTGAGPSCVPGNWDCSYDWVYSPDPPPPPPTGGGSGDPSSSTGMPLTAAEATRVNQGKTTATNKLNNTPDCEKMYDDLGANGPNVLSRTTYRDGTGSAACNSHPSAAAVTQPGSFTVLLCGTNFTNLSASGAAVVVIHEGLHSAGLNENPPDPSAMTSDQINQMVMSKCGLSW